MPIAVPITRRAPSMSRRPNAWPISIVAAMPKPNTNAIRRNMTRLPLVVAASASSPRKLPTQIALTEPFSDCSTEEPSVGSAKASRVGPIGPASGRRALVCLCSASAMSSLSPSLVRRLPCPTPTRCSRVPAGAEPSGFRPDVIPAAQRDERSASAAFASWSARAFSTASGLARSMKAGLARRWARESRSFRPPLRL